MNHPLQNRDFRWFLFSRIFGNLSLGFAEIPLMWWVLETTGQPALTATVALIGALAALVASPLGGVWADRGNKKRLIYWSYALDGLAQLGMVVGMATGSLNLWEVYVLVGMSGLFGNLRGPALGALTPLLLKESQYQQGNALVNLVSTLGLAASFALAGMATAGLGVAGAFWVGLGLIVLAGVALIPMREPAVIYSTPPQAAGAMLEGLRFIRQSPLLFWIVAIAMLLNLIMAPMAALQAPYAKLLGGNASDFGLMNTLMFVGQILSYTAMNFVRVPGSIWTMLLGCWGMAAAIGLLALAPTTWVALGLFGLAGMASGVLNTLGMTLLQSAIPKDMMGRVFGVLQGLNVGIQPLGLALASGLIAIIGLREVFAGMGVLLFVAALSFLLPSVRESLMAKPELKPVGGLD